MIRNSLGFLAKLNLPEKMATEDKWLSINLKAKEDSVMGKIISYVQEQPLGTKETVIELLLMYFAPVVLHDSQDAKLRHLADSYARKSYAVALSSMNLLCIEPNPKPRLGMPHAEGSRSFQGNGGASSLSQQQKEIEDSEDEEEILDHSSESLFR